MAILDSGERTVHPNGFQRDMHEGKGRMDLLPWRAIIEVSKHCEEGAKKYGERNIDKGCPQHSLIDSAMRHLAKYTIGMTDEDHLRACAWNILWALEQEVCRPDMQDIPARMTPVKEVGHDIIEGAKNNEFQKKFKNMMMEIREASNYNHAVEEPFHSINPERRCVEFTCYWNTCGFCQAVTDLWNPELGQECPDFSED